MVRCWLLVPILENLIVASYEKIYFTLPTNVKFCCNGLRVQEGKDSCMLHVPEPEQTICILKQNDKNHSMESDLISVIAGYKSYFIGELKIKL